ncbi:uroporphyrinogen decarboxylase [Iodidimonas nitroreducens]|uniref:Uroporphyrinogen decarboxylase n=1 Tax=Iodidimonas nitroreducens TaxID=1236968 RepID=A0A5A7N356_9PROT|nr:uroporphyrinogen decarboxylase [Iodidimonas nitroreducens]GAK34820.1 uroporphyrinogen decarboxylase [alpha proteobacterium Q-1]GER02457.1 uroporphyrinogen decarboxylase [Iodidimonas nitroreducens]
MIEKPILSVLKGERHTRPPFWFMRQAGRYLAEYRAVRAKAGSFLDLVYNPDLATEVTLQPVHRLKTDGAILFSDILIVPHALGQDVAFKQGEGPVLDPITSRADFAKLSLDALDERAAPVYQTVRQVLVALPPSVTLIGFCGGLWTVASYMVAGRGGDEQAAAKAWAYHDPEGFDQLLALLEEASFHYLVGQIDAGAEVIQIFESWAGNLPEPVFERFVIAPTQRLVARLKAARPTIPIIGFPRAAGPYLGDYAQKTGVDAISLDSGMKLSYADQCLPAKMAVQGNLDPQYVVAGGDLMEIETARILKALRGRPHIFNLGHGFVPHTPVAHVERLAAFLHEWHDQSQ